MGAVEDAVTRLAAQISGVTVYPYAVPDGVIPARYLVVHGTPGFEEGTRSTFTINQRTPTVWVMSVSRHTRPEQAAREAAWGAEKARDALVNYSPDGSWPFRHELSSPVQREENTTSTTASAVEQFSRRTSL